MTRDENILAMYLKEINKIPMISHEEEIELAQKAQSGDVAAKNKLVNANLRFVVNVAKKYQNHGLDLSDLISEGNLGLLTAVNKFDASKGYHFISYAVWCIRQSILKAICAIKRKANSTALFADCLKNALANPPYSIRNEVITF